jgi:ribosomal protein S18 acetylase RimI-like enzyme
VRRYPGLAYVADEGEQYVVAGLWRRRPEIAELIEASRDAERLSLIDTLSESLKQRGFRLLVIDYGLDARDPDFYRRAGFVLVERILEYERPDCHVRSRPRSSNLVVREYRSADRDEVLEAERESFPWLWWNSPAEWDSYLATAGVEVIVATVSDHIVGYAGFVVYHSDGHLDRLAVRQIAQGRGYGAELLTESLVRMGQSGARRVGLTTQEDNYRSQRLYEQNGFRRGRWTYEIHGRWLGPTEDSLT